MLAVCCKVLYDFLAEPCNFGLLMEHRTRPPEQDDRLRPHLIDLRHELAKLHDEFGGKVSIAATLDEGLIVGMRSVPGNPCDGHTLASPSSTVDIAVMVS